MRARGMTLVETLIALTVFVIITAALVTVLRGHLTMSGPLQMQADMIHDGRAALDIMLRELRHARSITSGERDSIQFIAYMPDGGPTPYPTVKYARRGRSLRRDYNGSGMQEVTLNVARVRFAYFNMEGNQVSPPITVANDQLVKRIEASISVTTADRRDTFHLTGSVVPRNIR